MARNNIYAPSTRKRIAYTTAISVFLSYFWLKQKAKILGKKYYDGKIGDLHLKNAQKIKDRVQELEGLFIKFGQLVSNLTNILPQQFRAPLESLQDHITAKDFADIEETIIKELGSPYHQIFSSFNQQPIAAASIGQVHRAVLNGKDVIVKIQHKDIDIVAKADLEILKNLVKMHAFFMDMQGLDHTYEQVKIMIEEELDYRQEAKAMQEIASNLASEKHLKIVIPQVVTQYNTKKILVAQYCEGTKIANIDQLKNWNIDTQELATRIIEMYCKMILIDGYYHADPHPGNILVNHQGDIILLDFGATARLSPQTKQALPELIEAVVKNNTPDTVAAMRKLGFVGSDKDSSRYVEQLILIFREFVEKEVEFDGLNFQNIKLNSGLGSLGSLLLKIDLRDVSHNIRIPKEYILLNRTIVLLLGNTYALAPQLNALNVVRPYVKNKLLGSKEDYITIIRNAFKNQITTALALPNELSSFLKSAQVSDIEFQLKGINSTLKNIYRLVSIFFYMLLLSCAFIMHSRYYPSLNWLGKCLFWVAIAITSFKLLLTFIKKPKRD